MQTVCVLTAAYNRAALLPRLFQSLLAQDDPDFIWIVVDDGSTDGTQALVQELQSRAPFPIVCHKKANGGKHTALNAAYPYVESPLTFIVDSDDTLTPDAISVIKAVYEEYRPVRLQLPAGETGGRVLKHIRCAQKRHEGELRGLPPEPPYRRGHGRGLVYPLPAGISLPGISGGDLSGGGSCVDSDGAEIPDAVF